MSKTANYKEMVKAANIDGIVKSFWQIYYNKYYDLFCKRFEIEGFDYRYTKTLRSKLFSKGSIWIRKNSITGEPICCDYAGSTWDWNNLPVTVQLVTLNGAPQSIIPTSPQVVDKDGVIIWIRPGEKGYQQDVEYYISKLAQAEAAITINLELQKAPWLLSSDSTNYAKLLLFVKQILSNAPVVITDINKDEIDVLKLDTPWLIDKLVEYEDVLEGRLKTLLGIDNQGGHINSQQQNLDTTNSNNDEINTSQAAFIETLEDGVERANKVLGLNLKVIDKMPKVTQDSTSKGLGEEHNSKEEEQDE